ncbi:regulatory protein GemA [uncultured Maricaulis sp.]|uniref:regulatory protein GemA n=1 Tax=uncultured Maricaulis sp. TaxID=174710 RepID=UPI0030DBA2FB|tara:strand:- start:145344 stop:146009 length:666 start_codon:yes stop_codon:yes gene_type:complete
MSALAAMHVAKKQLGLDEATYRDVLAQVTGKSSAKSMSDGERKLVLARFREMGFGQGSTGRKKGLEGPYAKKLQALWIAGWNLGLVQDRKDSALIAFVRRQTGIDHIRFLHEPEDAAKAIEALKAWMAREAGVEWNPGRQAYPWALQPGYRIALAQFELLKRATASSTPTLLPTDARQRDQTLTLWMQPRRYGTPATVIAAEWHAVMNELGRLLRDARRSV